MSATTKGGTNLSAAWAFLADELRRGALAVAGGLLAVVVLALAPRLMPSMENAHGADVRLAAALAGLVLVLPLLGLYLATSGWARERTDGTLGWLYVRPLSANAIFALRVAAFAVTLFAFAALVLLATWTAPADLITHPAIGEHTSLFSYTPLVVTFLALALFVSATAAGGRLAPMLAATAGGLAALALLPELPLPELALLADPVAAALRRAVLLYAVFPLALVAGAWVAVRRAVLDRRTRWRGVAVAAAIAAGGALVSTALALHQTWGDPWQAVAVRALPDGGELRLSSGHGYDSWVLRGELTGEGDERTEVGVFLVPRVYVSPGGGVAIFEGLRTSPRMLWVGADGERRSVAFDAAVEMVGWSTDGRRLAVQMFEASAVDGLSIFDSETGTLRPLALPWLAERPSLGSPRWTAAWIDDRHLLLWSLAEGGWWAVADASGRRVAEGEQEAGVRLEPAAPTFRWWPVGDDGRYEVAPALVPRRGGGLLVWRRQGERRALAAVAPDGAFEPLAERPARAGWPERIPFPDLSLGVAGGTAVWIEGNAVQALPAGGGLRSSCELPVDFYDGVFRGASGRFAVWSPSPFGDAPHDRLFVCDVGSGEAELVGDLGPWGHHSVEVTDGGLLTPSGVRPLGG